MWTTDTQEDQRPIGATKENEVSTPEPRTHGGVGRGGRRSHREHPRLTWELTAGTIGGP